MSQFFISCKESRIESNKSFYGCFHLGPFEPSQSITIANTLRRTLLSELYGLGIVSVEIEGATHEYSSLPGIKESVLDILLNLKEIVLKKTIKNFKPQIGYLRVRGPGVVRAAHLRLPPFIQSVDPEQYIATLADDGILNMKFVIQYGNKWVSSNTFNQRTDNMDENKNTVKTDGSINIFNLNLKKRQLILKKLKQIGIISANTYINMFSKSSTLCFKKKSLSKYGINIYAKFNKKYSGINLKIAPQAAHRGATQGPRRVKQTLKNISKSIEKSLLVKKKYTPPMGLTKTSKSEVFKNGVLLKQNLVTKNSKKQNLKFQGSNNLNQLNSTISMNKKTLFFNSNPLNIDAVFNPINKVNYIIDVNDFKTTASKIQFSSETSELYEMFKNNNSLKPKYFDPIKKRETDLKNFIQKQLCPNPPYGGVNGDKSIISSSSTLKWDSEISEEIENILDIKSEINILKKETTKHNITLEIWTNGSLHPRDALYQSFKHLIKIFSKLKKLNSFVETCFFDPITPTQTLNQENKKSLFDFYKYASYNKTSSNSFSKTRNEQKEIKSVLKRIKLGEINSSFLKNLLPLNDTSYLSTYVNPKLKDYYLNPISVDNLKKKLSSNQDKICLDKELNLGIAFSSSWPPVGGQRTTNYSLGQDQSNNLLDSKQIEILIQANIGILNLSLRSYTSLKRLGLNSIEDLIYLSKNNSLILNSSKKPSSLLITADELKKKLDYNSIKEIENSFEKIGLIVIY